MSSQTESLKGQLYMSDVLGCMFLMFEYSLLATVLSEHEVSKFEGG